MAREAWTDERLDDLTQRVDEGFNRNECEFQAVRLEIRTEFAAVRSEIRDEIGGIRDEIGSLRSEIRSEIGSVRSEVVAVRSDINALSRLIAQVSFGALAALFVGLASLIATQL
jgi:hypothetical protein